MSRCGWMFLSLNDEKRSGIHSHTTMLLFPVSQRIKLVQPCQCHTHWKPGDIKMEELHAARREKISSLMALHSIPLTTHATTRKEAKEEMAMRTATGHVNIISCLFNLCRLKHSLGHAYWSSIWVRNSLRSCYDKSTFGYVSLGWRWLDRGHGMQSRQSPP